MTRHRFCRQPCATCHHWRLITRRDGQRADGECHLDPPTVAPRRSWLDRLLGRTPAQARPRTRASDWCSHHRPME